MMNAFGDKLSTTLEPKLCHSNPYLDIKLVNLKFEIKYSIDSKSDDEIDPLESNSD